MIGFTISASSNIGYSSSSNPVWSEGKLWLAKAALSTSSVPGTQLFTPDHLGGLEKGFGTMKNALLRDVGAINNWFFLGIYGTPFLFLEMDPTLPADVIVNRLLDKVKNNRAPLGDQVMLYVAKLIVQFDEYIRNYGTGSEKAPTLAITVNL